MKLAKIAKRLGVELRGEGSVEIEGAAGIQEAGPSEITFVSNPKYIAQIENCRAGAIILSPSAPKTPIPTLLTSNPYLTFARALELFYAPPETIPGIHPTATIAETARLGADHSIGANVVIGDQVVLGDRAVLHPQVVVYPGAVIGSDFTAHSQAVVREHCRLGDRVTLQNGAVIGADGFGFAPRGDEGGYYKIVQSGIVVLEDDVEIGAHAAVDRATVGETRIKKGTKIDNLVQIGHGSTVGPESILAAQVGLAGSTRVGRNVTLAGQVGVAGHLVIEDNVQATAQTGIARSVKGGRTISGTPEMDSALWKRNYLLMQRFPEMYRRLRQLEKQVTRLQRNRQADRKK